MGTTNNYNIPYPEGGDPVAVAQDMRRLADQTDASIKDVENRAVTEVIRHGDLVAKMNGRHVYEQPLSFGYTFGNTPTVVAITDDSRFITSVHNITTSGCTVGQRHFEGRSTNEQQRIHWIAIGRAR